jgi:hypothetical protein
MTPVQYGQILLAGVIIGLIALILRGLLRDR